MKKDKLSMNPKDVLIEGSKVIQQFLEPHGFRFQLRGEGAGSGGTFAWGEFIREERRLELHFRYSLGMVKYQVGDQGASHEAYMRELGVWQECRYPGFSQDPIAAFHDLAHDLAFADDFLSGSGEILQRTAERETEQHFTATRPSSKE